jgi:LPS export ABC transporter protein LptC
MNNRKFFHNKFFTAALFTGCFFVFSCENDEREIKELTESKTMIEEARDIESYLSQDGEMKARLKAPLMLRVMVDSLYIEFPKTLHIDFFDSTQEVQSWVDAKYGKYYENHNKAFLRDSVVVINTLGDTLKCHDLWWDQNRQIFYTDQYAIYHSKDRQIYGGKGMEASQDLKTIIFKQPTGTVKVSDSGFPE